MKTQATDSSLPCVRQHAGQRLSVFLTVLAVVAAVRVPAWGGSVNDIIWLETNSTTGNSILAFRNTGSGSPTFLGSTPAGGIGVFDKTFALGPFDSDQNLITDPNGTLLFAVNSGSNSIAVFRITSNGLQAVEGSPFPSGGTDPLAWASRTISSPWSTKTRIRHRMRTYICPTTRRFVCCRGAHWSPSSDRRLPLLMAARLPRRLSR